MEYDIVRIVVCERNFLKNRTVLCLYTAHVNSIYNSVAI